MGAGADVIHDGHGSDGASGHVVRVLHGDEAGLRHVIRGRRDFGGHEIPGENALRGGDGPDDASAEPAQHGHFIVEDVSALFADNLLTGAGVQLDGDLVAHGSGGNEDGGFASEDFSGASFEAIDGGVFGVNVIANLSGGHGAAHGVAGQSYGVAAKVNPRSAHECLCSDAKVKTPV